MASGDQQQRKGPVLERSSTWAGLRKGDPVAVSGTRLRSAQWEFVAHVRNATTGEEWVEVVGGRPGDRALRSFRTEQVLPPPGRSKGKKTGRNSGSAPPFAVAPRLPFGDG